VLKKTKATRIDLTVRVLEANDGVPIPIKHWLELINCSMHSNLRYRNTLELSRSFRAIKGLTRVKEWRYDVEGTRMICYYKYQKGGCGCESRCRGEPVIQEL
jgi:hypothetical protein